jgi:hypothetical protein
MTKNFIIKFDDVLSGMHFESSVEEIFTNADIPIADEYIINWYESPLNIEIESIEADDEVVWSEKTIDIDDWTEDDDRIIEGLIGYIENNII